MDEEKDDFSTVPSGIRKKMLEEARKREAGQQPAQKAPSPVVAPPPKPQPAPPAPIIAPKEEKKVEEIKPQPAPQQAPAPVQQQAPPQLPALPKIPEVKPAPRKQEVVYIPQLPPPQVIQEPAPVEEVRRPQKEAPMARRREEYEEDRIPKKHLLSSSSRSDSYDYGVYTQPAAPRKGGIGGFLVYIVLIVALASLYFAYTASSEVALVKGEMGGMANDLKIFRSKEISVMAPMSGNVVLKKELPISGIFPPTLRATGTLILPIKTTLTAYSSTGGTIYQVPIDQNVSIDFIAPLDFSKTGVGQSLIIDDQIPVGNYITIKITARDVWGNDLDMIINRLEQASQ